MPTSVNSTPEVRRYAEVALPVPVDRLFTYALPDSLGDNVRAGCRLQVPFGARVLVGVVVRAHNNADSDHQIRDALKLLDADPVLEPGLLHLGQWVAEYYCAPIGEVLKGMLPLSGEMRRTQLYSLSPEGLGVARQLTIGSEQTPSSAILRLLEERARTASFLASKVQNAKRELKVLLKQGLVEVDATENTRDPLRASAERLAVEFVSRPGRDAKLRKSERELLAFLELHPGAHNLARLGETLKNAGETARSLGRRNLLRLTIEQSRPALMERPVPVLNAHQQAAFDAVSLALAENVFSAFLLQGVTGSGKTEVYMRSIDACLALGRNALLLVPEIALTPAVAGQFFHRFGDKVAILHSAFGDSERADQWRRIRGGTARVVVGTRSGIFAPIQQLGLVIIDEEHDGSYKQHETPRYHGRDVAIMRAKQAGAVALLGSATPSIESRYNADTGKYKLLRLPVRIARRPMPDVELIDMRQEFLETKRQATFSRQLMEEMRQRLQAGEQTMLLLNRRGFSSFMLCRECGERLQCVNCSVVLTYHKRDRRMLCHYCGYAEKIPEECPKCGSDYIQFLGTGSERVEDELHEHLPTARIARLDRDTASAKGAFETILQSFREGHVDILVGTQMIAKGHDIPNVTLVGVVLADIGLSMPDFRAAERTFQLLTQAAGRAGRGQLPGRVLVQTLNPEHYAIQLAAQQDYEAFYKKELEFRKWLRYPPFSAFASVVVRDPSQQEALRKATQLGYLLMPPPEGSRIIGPAEAPVPRLQNEFRYQILIKASKRAAIRSVLNRMREMAEQEKWRPTALTIDVDPISLM